MQWFHRNLSIEPGTYLVTGGSIGSIVAAIQLPVTRVTRYYLVDC